MFHSRLSGVELAATAYPLAVGSLTINQIANGRAVVSIFLFCFTHTELISLQDGCTGLAGQIINK